MATYTVTNTQDTDADLTPEPADVAGSLRAALDAALTAGGGSIAFNLPSGSTIALLDELSEMGAPVTVDFTGAPGLVLSSSPTGSTYSTYGPFDGFVADDALTISGSVTADASFGVIAAAVRTGSVTLAAGSSLVSNSMDNPVIEDGGTSLTLSANSRVAATQANAIIVSQGYGVVANQTVTIGAGAVVSDTSTPDPTIYVGASTQGAVITNSGTISATVNNAYYTSATSTTNGVSYVNNATLMNTASGVITDSSTSGNAAVNLAGKASLQNAGLVSQTGNSNAVYSTGTGAVTNTGSLTSNTGIAYYATNASKLTNSGSISSSGGPAIYLGAGGALINSSGVISGGNGAAAILSGATSGTESISLLAGSTTTGNVGGTAGGSLFLVVAGTLNGSVVSGAKPDNLFLVNGLAFNGTINLGGGVDTLTLEGTNPSGASTLVGANVLSAVSLLKLGAGTWTLQGAGANYTGVTFSDGVLELTAVNSAGTGAITFGAGVQTLQLDTPASGAFTLANTLTGFGVEDLLDVRGTTVTGASVAGDVLTLTTASGGAATVTFASGTLAGRTLAVFTDGEGGSEVSTGAVAAPATVAAGQTVSLAPAASGSTTPTVVAGNVTDNGSAQIGGAGAVTYTGAISGAGSLTVSGQSTVTLTGTSTYTGPTTVASGTLVVNGSIASSPVSVDAGATLGGSGTTGALTAQSGATVSPGNSPGVITTTGDLTLAAGSTLLEQIAGVANGSTTMFDQINVNGKANLNGAVLSAVLYGGYTPPTSGTGAFTIIHTTGGVTGAFAGLAEGATFTLGAEQVTISYVGGADHTDVTLQFSAPAPTAPATTPVSPPAPSAPAIPLSQQQGFSTAVDNLIRVAASDASLANPVSAAYAQVQAEKGIAAQLDAGIISTPDAQAALFHLVDGTTSVAETTYAFFTGKTPTAAGLDYLVSSAANPNNLDSAYYAQFTTENRYINFAVNLATGSGAGAAAFQAAYGALSLTDATAQAYQSVFGITPTADKVAAILNAQVSNGLGGTETRAQYLADITGGGAVAQKAAVVGFLLADSVREGFGAYQQADLHFLQDLAHGTAVFNVDLLGAYSQAPVLVGQPVVETTLGS